MQPTIQQHVHTLNGLPKVGWCSFLAPPTCYLVITRMGEEKDQITPYWCSCVDTARDSGPFRLSQISTCLGNMADHSACQDTVSEVLQEA